MTSAGKWGGAALGQPHNVDRPPSYVTWEYTAERSGSVTQQMVADVGCEPDAVKQFIPLRPLLPHPASGPEGAEWGEDQ